MSHDLRGYIVSGLQRLGYNGLSMIGSVSKSFMEEQRQLKEQEGPIKRTHTWDYIGELGHVIGVATKYIFGKRKTQRSFLLGSDGTVIVYKFLPERGYGILMRDGKVLEKARPDNAVNKMLLEAYGLSHQPH